MLNNPAQATESKSQVGRPKQSQSKIRQYFYIEEAELILVRAAARQKQLSVSAHVRTLILESLVAKVA